MKTIPPLVDRAIRFHIRKYVTPSDDLYGDLYNSAFIHVLEAVEKGLDLERKGAIRYLNMRLPGRIFADYRRLTAPVTLSHGRANRTKFPAFTSQEYDLDDESEDTHPSPETQAIVRQALEVLTDQERTVFVGLAVEGKDEWQVALELDLLPVVVADLYDVAAEKLREALD